jgi:hypothetical protein
MMSGTAILCAMLALAVCVSPITASRHLLQDNSTTSSAPSGPTFKNDPGCTVSISVRDFDYDAKGSILPPSDAASGSPVYYGTILIKNTGSDTVETTGFANLAIIPSSKTTYDDVVAGGASALTATVQCDGKDIPVGETVACDYIVPVPANFTSKLSHLNVTIALASGSAESPELCFSQKPLVATAEAAGFVRPTIQPQWASIIVQVSDYVAPNPGPADPPAVIVFSNQVATGDDDTSVDDGYYTTIGK